MLVAIEHTGHYHQVVQRAFRAAGFEVRIIHLFATKPFRQARDPGNKTDDTDLVALQRAAVSGFARAEASLDLACTRLAWISSTRPPNHVGVPTHDRPAERLAATIFRRAAALARVPSYGPSG